MSHIHGKGNRRRSIGHCPNLWKPPLQPIRLTIKDFAVQAEMVAVENSIDVGNILWIFYDCLYHDETPVQLGKGHPKFSISESCHVSLEMDFSSTGFTWDVY